VSVRGDIILHLTLTLTLTQDISIWIWRKTRKIIV
jgi:hypothetical protein